MIQQQQEQLKDKVTLELNQQILKLAYDNKKLSEEIKIENKNQFEAAVSPDLRLEGGRVVGCLLFSFGFSLSSSDHSNPLLGAEKIQE